MGMKRPRVLASYRAGAPQPPSAATDQRVLAMARDAVRARPASWPSLRLALAATVALAAVFSARWMVPGSTAPEITGTNFGLEEGQARTWLSNSPPTLAATGPGSREGMP